MRGRTVSNYLTHVTRSVSLCFGRSSPKVARGKHALVRRLWYEYKIRPRPERCAKKHREARIRFKVLCALSGRGHLYHILTRGGARSRACLRATFFRVPSGHKLRNMTYLPRLTTIYLPGGSRATMALAEKFVSGSVSLMTTAASGFSTFR